MEEEEPAVVPPPNRRRTVSPSNARHSEPVEPPSPTPHNPSPQDIPRSREPYEEREDFLDVTSNLNPLLDSILDLSGVAEHDGELQHPMIFGGAKRVWEVVGAYESAVEQSGMGSTVDVDTAAKLPSALFSGDVYNALTVLNISNNQLEKIEVLPKSLLRLDISKNKLTSLVGMGQCKMLTVVNARRNEIREISGLEHNRCIAHLFLGRNKIELVQGLAHLMLLETLDLTYNLLKTQNSIRALSLCPALHHLLLNGNAVVTSMKGRHIPVLRNLCPSLLVVDDVKVSSSRFADALLSQKNSLRQPERIRDSFQPNVPNATLIESRSHIDVHVADRSDMSEESSAPQSANVLHMLTQGVTAVTGYGDGVRVSQGARQMARLAQEKEAEEEKKRRARLTANGKNIRSEIVKQLAEESQRYLENTIVERLMQKTNADVSQLSKSTQEAVKQPAQGKLNLSQQDQELLKHYEPTKFKAPRTRQASQQKRKNTTKSVLSNTKPVEATLDHMYEVPSGEEETPLSYAAQLRKERSAPRQSSSTERKSTSPSHSPPRTLGLRRSESLEPRYTPSEKRPSPLKEATPKEVVPTTTYAPAPLKTVVHRDPALGEWPPAAKHKTEKYSVPPPLQKENRNPIAHADSDQKAKIDLWRRKLQHDSDAVQEALKSLVTLLRAHCPTKMAVPEKSSELPKTYQEERQKCINEISKSGLLEDVTVPLDVVVHYGFKKSELDSETTRKSSGEGPGSGWNSEMSEREDVLRMIRMMGDAKTCLRYTIMLVNDGRERPMQDYVTQVLQHL
ncbi:hypothetical protein AGDE_15270 [Angomonas deanei]|nr:hypothetical protein AGDE_15270 [Angomonas deanei]|eukprot:EPY19374.1 hypothetical protein AGDE_15270 [Angomonas deanei]